MWIFCSTLILKMVRQYSEDFLNKESCQTMEQLLGITFLSFTLVLKLLIVMISSQEVKV